MARLIPLAECLKLRRGILFDTSALFEMFAHEERHATTHPLLLRIQPTHRYTSIVNMFEFVCDKPREVVRNRRSWLKDKGIRSVPVTQAISATFQSLLGETVGCHLLRDLMTAATAKAERLALASQDNDFQDISGILWVAEFARPE